MANYQNSASNRKGLINSLSLRESKVLAIVGDTTNKEKMYRSIG